MVIQSVARVPLEGLLLLATHNHVRTSNAKISSGTRRKHHFYSIHFSFSACAPGRPRHAASSPLQDAKVRHPCCQRSCRLRCIGGLHGDSVVYHGAFAWRVTWNNRLTKEERGITNYTGFLSFSKTGIPYKLFWNEGFQIFVRTLMSWM